MARPKLKDSEKKKKMSFTLDPRVFEKWNKFCDELRTGDEKINQSILFEEIIKEKIKYIDDIIEYKDIELENISYLKDIILNLNGEKTISKNTYEYWISYYSRDIEKFYKNSDKFMLATISDYHNQSADYFEGEDKVQLIERYEKRLSIIKMIYKQLYL